MPAPPSTAQRAANAAAMKTATSKTSSSSSAKSSTTQASASVKTSTPAKTSNPGKTFSGPAKVSGDSSRIPSAVTAVQTKLGVVNTATRQARLNMMKDPTNPNLPGMHGPGGFAGTQPGSSLREQGAAMSMLAKDMTDRYGMSPDAAKAFVEKAAKTIAGEGAGETQLGRDVIAKTMLNRMDLGATMKKQDGQYTTDPDRMLSAYDANGTRPGTTPNETYTKAVPGTNDFQRALAAINAAVTPGAISPALSKFTHYRTQEMGAPSWENGATFNVGAHVFSNPDFSRTKVASAQGKLDGSPTPDVMDGFQPASFTPPGLGKLVTDRLPQPGVTTKKMFSDRVPGATAEPASYSPGMPELPGAISVSPDERINGAGYSPSISISPDARVMGAGYTPRMGVSPDARVNGAGYSSPDVSPDSSPTSPLAFQGSSWPVQGTEDFRGYVDSNPQALDTIDGLFKHWDAQHPLPDSSPVKVADKTVTQKIQSPFDAGRDKVMPGLEKMNTVFGGSGYNDLYGRPSLGSGYDLRGRGSERTNRGHPEANNQFVQNGNLLALLRSYFNGG